MAILNRGGSRRALPILLFHGLAVALWGVHLYVGTLAPTTTPIPPQDSPEARWWGLWPMTYLPSWAITLSTALLLLGMAVAWYRLRQPARQPRGTGSGHGWVWPLSLILWMTFFLFPIVHTRWGDAYILTYGLAWPDPALRLTHSWQAPWDVWLHSRFWHWAAPVLGWETGQPVYRLLSPLAGGLYLTTLSVLSRRWPAGTPWLTYGLLSTLGVMQLFYGYVENYSFAAAGVLLYLTLGLEVVTRGAALWPAALALALTNGLHPSTIVLAPSLLWLGRLQWQRCRSPRGPAAALGILAQIALPMLAVAGATVLLMELGGHGVRLLFTEDRPGGGDGRWLVPLWSTTTRWEHYTLFSWAHLRDFLNLQMLVGPVILPTLLVGWLFQGIRRMGRDGPAETPLDGAFLAVAAAGYLLFAGLWNPDYGGQRDWDLFSLSTIPLALILARQLPRLLPARDLPLALLPLLWVQAVHLVAWIYQNTLPWEWP